MGKFFNCDAWKIEHLKAGIYTIPQYQRAFSWTKVQILDLLTTLFEGYNQDKPVFLGALYFKDNGKYMGVTPQYEIVDGQQRISVLMLMYMILLIGMLVVF